MTIIYDKVNEYFKKWIIISILLFLSFFIISTIYPSINNRLFQIIQYLYEFVKLPFEFVFEVILSVNNYTTILFIAGLIYFVVQIFYFFTHHFKNW